MMRRLSLFSVIFSLFVSLSTAADPLKEFPSRVKKLTLPNGLRVIVVERPTSPAISFAMYLKTGGMDDESGKTGLAHMFEHMLFKGTKTVGTKNYEKEKLLLEKMDVLQAEVIANEVKQSAVSDQEKQIASLPTVARNDILKKISDLEAELSALSVDEEFWKIYERAGGSGLNASTGYDFTNYVISLPKNQLPLWAAMEADRLKDPVLREFYKERAVVMEERRMRVDNSPQGKLWEAFLATAFLAHPYGRPIVGWESDISRVTRHDAEQFFKAHYGIDRLVIAIVGGVSADEVFRLVKKNFGAIKAPERYVHSHISQEPPQEGERRVEVEYDAEPNVVVGYHRPDMHDPDEVVFTVLDRILSSGRTSRFNKSLIEKKKVATSAWSSGSFPGERAPNLFVMGGSPRPPHTTQDLETAFEDEIEKIKNGSISDEEMERVRTSVEAELVRGLDSNEGLARQLAYYEAVGGQWNYLFDYLDKLRNVTAADVQRVAKKYLTKNNRTVGTLVKKK